MLSSAQGIVLEVVRLFGRDCFRPNCLHADGPTVAGIRPVRIAVVVSARSVPVIKGIKQNSIP